LSSYFSNIRGITAFAEQQKAEDQKAKDACHAKQQQCQQQENQ
jgi:hypothetical protein